LRASIEAVLNRHDSLRTRFVDSRGAPEQSVTEARAFELEVIDLSRVPTARVPGELHRLAAGLIREDVSLSEGPLFAARLFKLTEQDHVLLCALDHMICDGTSLRIIDEEIWSLYRQTPERGLGSLPALDIQFPDYAAWQARTYPAWRSQHEPYWRQHLAGAPSLRLPAHTGMAEAPGVEGALYRASLGREISDGLRRLAGQERAGLSLVVCTLYTAVMLRWCGHDESVLTFVSSRRYRRELAPMVGFVAGLLNLRVGIVGTGTYRSLLRRISAEFYAAVAHDDFDRLPDLLPGCGLQGTDLYFNWLPAYAGEGYVSSKSSDSVDEAFTLQPYRFRVAVPWGFLPAFFEDDGEIGLFVNHVPHLFPESTVECFVQNLKEFAVQFTQNPAAPIGSFRR
jgi:hypothetical protein